MFLVLFSVAMFYCHYTCVWLFAAETIFLVIYFSLLKLRKSTAFDAKNASAEVYFDRRGNRVALFAGCA